MKSPSYLQNLKETGLFSGFQQKYEVIYANSEQLKRIAYSIRHQVYCTQLGETQHKKHGMDIDSYDSHAHHLLIRHSASGVYLGTIRVIPSTDQTSLLPIEDLAIESEWASKISPKTLARGCFSEISRLAISTSFNQQNASGFNYGMNNGNRELFDENKLRKEFPEITLGLYLAATGLARLLFQDYIFVMMPPMLFKKLRGNGLMFDQASYSFEQTGTKAIYLLDLNKGNTVAEPIYPLYDAIVNQVSPQLHLFPTIEDSKDLSA